MNIKLSVLFIILFAIGCASPPKEDIDLKAFNPKSLKNWVMVIKMAHPEDDSREIRFFINRDVRSDFNSAMIETEYGKITSYHYKEEEILHSYSLNLKTNELEAILLNSEQLVSIKKWLQKVEVSYYVKEQTVRKKKSEYKLEYEEAL